MDDLEYETAPSPEEGDDELYVDVGVEVCGIDNISTVNTSADVDVQLVFFWTDSRFISDTDNEWHAGQPLPDDTWGPTCQLLNQKGPKLRPVRDVTFDIHDPQTGRLKRTRNYRATLNFQMQYGDLQNFPFDVHTLPIHFRTCSDYELLSGSHQGNSSGERTYKIRTSSPFLRVKWADEDDEWEVHGISADMNHEEKQGAGYYPSNVRAYIHMSRRSRYYIAQVLTPLFLTSALSFGTFVDHIPNLGNRMTYSLTCLVAQFALLYSVQQNIPNLPFLTCIDWAIFSSVCISSMSGLTSMLFFALDHWSYQNVALELNRYMGIVLFVVYVAWNAYNIFPKLRYQRATVLKMMGERINISGDASAKCTQLETRRNKFAPVLPPTKDAMVIMSGVDDEELYELYGCQRSDTMG